MKNSRFLRGCAVLTTAAFLFVPSAFAQAQGGSGGGSTGGNTGGSTGGNTGGSPGNVPGSQPGGDRQQTPFPGSTDRQQPRFPEMQRPIFLQGNVVFEDGTPAPPNVIIERVCSGQPFPEGYTNSKGQFNFEVGRGQNVIADASTNGSIAGGTNPADPFGGGGFGSPGASRGGISERDLMGCELRANLAGYRSSSVELSGRRMFDNPDVGTLILRKMGEVTGLTISMTSMQAPKKAQKGLKSGIKNAQKQKWDKAQQDLEEATALFPEYAEAWSVLGQVYEAQNKPELAREAYSKSISADSKYLKPHVALAMMDARETKWQEVADATGMVIKMNPYDFPEAYFLNSVANLNLNNAPAAEKSAREALELNVERKFPQVEHILGLALASQDNYGEAAEHLKKYLELAPEANNAETARQQLVQVQTALDKQGGSSAPKQAAVPAESTAPQQ